MFLKALVVWMIEAIQAQVRLYRSAPQTFREHLTLAFFIIAVSAALIYLDGR